MTKGSAKKAVMSQVHSRTLFVKPDVNGNREQRRAAKRAAKKKGIVQHG
jgi:ribosomal protein S21